MKKELLDGTIDEYRFDLSFDEVRNRICNCLVQTNKDIRIKDIYKDKNAREFKALFVRKDGEEVNVSVGVPNLKRYFGAFILGVKDDGGIWFHRRLKK